MNKFLDIFKETLSSISHPRFFETERGFQGELNARLAQTLKGIIPDQHVIEEEYQKRFKAHGIRIRPDIIIHTPFQQNAHESRTEGNFAAIQIKLKAGEKDAKEDFEKLDLMFEKLNYPLGIFINISSNETFYEKYEGKYIERLHCFSVELTKSGEVIIDKNPKCNNEINERLNKRIKEVLGFDDVGLDLYNESQRNELSEIDESMMISGLDLIEAQLIHSEFLDEMTTALKTKDAQGASDAANKLIERLDELIDKTEDSEIKESLSKVADHLYRKFLKHSKR
ncbi:hypothetical protein ACFQ21_10225 [Ohtaekwangia kribbensis]|uniref:Uncharacterized protein n=1 Tax=Ohtaekwangia kribbensis TaxID=688913 RepID=A0ABW3K2M2_9BACT